MSKHTPGPWFVSLDAQFNDLHVTTEKDVGLQRQKHAVCFFGNTSADLSERTANATLIAAAPEMLAALEEVKSDYIDNCSRAEWHENCADIEAVIRKARGES